MDVDDGKLPMSTTLSQRFPFEMSVPLDPILKIEEEILKKLAEEDIYDEDSKDILPTSGTDGACTALITKIHAAEMCAVNVTDTVMLCKLAVDDGKI